MESLNDTTWDVVIDGTGLSQSLLALALSRSGSRILHLDQNDYYGGNEAALGLHEAQEWAERFAGETGRFRHAKVTHPSAGGTTSPGLAASRSYTLTLSPQLIYGRSNLLQALVRSRTHEQVDFQAVGSFWVVERSAADVDKLKILRVPSGREDIFQDKTINLRAKRSLMNFIRSITGDDSPESEQPQAATEAALQEQSFPEVLNKRYKLPVETHAQLLALALSTQSPSLTTYKAAVHSIKRHLLSMGMFGSGFGAVMPKYGGLSEIVQVACRACAVGGGVYVLGNSVASSTEFSHNDTEASGLRLELDGGQIVMANWLITPTDHVTDAAAFTMVKSISVVNSPLRELFPPTSVEGGVTPAGAVILLPALNPDEPPVHIFVHSADSGECPRNQCILYASILSGTEIQDSVTRLGKAVDGLLNVSGAAKPAAAIDPGTEVESVPKVLWQLTYEEHCVATTALASAGKASHNIALPQGQDGLVLEDDVLESVRVVWQTITGEDEAEFMKFTARDGEDAAEGEIDT